MKSFYGLFKKSKHTFFAEQIMLKNSPQPTIKKIQKKKEKKKEPLAFTK